MNVADAKTKKLLCTKLGFFRKFCRRKWNSNTISFNPLVIQCKGSMIKKTIRSSILNTTIPINFVAFFLRPLANYATGQQDHVGKSLTAVNPLQFGYSFTVVSDIEWYKNKRLHRGRSLKLSNNAFVTARRAESIDYNFNAFRILGVLTTKNSCMCSPLNPSLILTYSQQPLRNF